MACAPSTRIIIELYRKIKHQPSEDLSASVACLAYLFLSPVNELISGGTWLGLYATIRLIPHPKRATRDWGHGVCYSRPESDSESKWSQTARLADSLARCRKVKGWTEGQENSERAVRPSLVPSRKRFGLDSCCHRIRKVAASNFL